MSITLFSASEIVDGIDMDCSGLTYKSEKSWKLKLPERNGSELQTDDLSKDPYGQDNSAQLGEHDIMNGMGYAEQMNVWRPESVRYGSYVGIPSHGGI